MKYKIEEIAEEIKKTNHIIRCKHPTMTNKCTLILWYQLNKDEPIEIGYIEAPTYAIAYAMLCVQLLKRHDMFTTVRMK